jgi:hypothetical protein
MIVMKYITVRFFIYENGKVGNQEKTFNLNVHALHIIKFGNIARLYPWKDLTLGNIVKTLEA